MWDPIGVFSGKQHNTAVGKEHREKYDKYVFPSEELPFSPVSFSKVRQSLSEIGAVIAPFFNGEELTLSRLMAISEKLENVYQIPVACTKKTFFQLLGKKCDFILSMRMSCKVQEFRRQMKEGYYIPAYKGDAWSLMKCLEAEYTQGGLGAVFLCVTGPAAGELLTVTIPPLTARQLLIDCGVPKRGRVDPKELFNSFIYGKLSYVNGKKALVEHKTGSALSSYNSQLHKARWGCSSDKTCGNCYKGIDACPFALKRQSHEKRHCNGFDGNPHEGWYKPSDKVDLCIDCRKKNRKALTTQ